MSYSCEYELYSLQMTFIYHVSFLVIIRPENKVDLLLYWTREMWCTDEACLKEMDEMKGLLCDDDENDDIEDFVHCESPNCHIMYWKHKNGAVCEDCYTNICENCAMDEMATFLYGEDFFCPDCLKRRLNNGSIDYCQNRRKECKTFVNIKKNESAFLCLQCDSSFCDDCQRSELVKSICRSCRLRKRKYVK